MRRQPRLGDLPPIGAVGNLAAHVGQRGGVELAGDLVQSEDLLIGQLVAAVQRHHVLGPHDRRSAVGEHNHVTRNVGVGGGGPCRVDLPGA